MVKIKIKKEDNSLALPEYATSGSAGCDLRSAENLILRKGEIKLVSTGLRVFLPAGYEGHIRPRSGLAFKHGVTVLNSPGTIDEDYTGVVGVILVNHGDKDFEIKKGDRIAQFVVAKYEKAEWDEVDDFDETGRKGGFGSTGLS